MSWSDMDLRASLQRPMSESDIASAPTSALLMMLWRSDYIVADAVAKTGAPWKADDDALCGPVATNRRLIALEIDRRLPAKALQWSDL